MSKCPKCDGEAYSTRPSDPGYPWRCTACFCIFTDWQQAEIERLTEENKSLREGFNAEGHTAAENCCTAFKQNLQSEIAKLRAGLERMREFLNVNVKDFSDPDDYLWEAGRLAGLKEAAAIAAETLEGK